MDIQEYRRELIDSAKERMACQPTDIKEIVLGMFYEFSDRLTRAEEFSDIIPCHYRKVGYRGKKISVDGYQYDEADSSMRLIICDFSPDQNQENLTRSRAENVFRQVFSFVYEAIVGSLSQDSEFGNSDLSELASIVKHKIGQISRFRFYLFTDSVLSGRITDLQEDKIDNVSVEYHIWDISRLAGVSASALGLEEMEIDLTEFVPEGVPCLFASTTEDYQGYLAVIPGEALATLYDKYGSKLLEGNVRSYLTARGKVNKNIQGTVRAEPEKFFIFNNGITCTATSAHVESGDRGSRLLSVKYLQIVNGGQTIASLHTALRLGKADLSKIYVQMKLSVVTANEPEKLEDLIERIARYSNSQNKVSEADFFSNHPYHRALERLSRRISAPAANGAQYNTYWFFERARGQYQNAQLHLTPAKKKEFQRLNPRSQMFVKTDVAKFENSWMRLPHVVSQGAQKNFSNFAIYISKKWGQDGKGFNNEGYFRNVASRAILFRSLEKLVSNAPWYQTGLPRAQIVTYTVSKLSEIISQKEEGANLDFKVIWDSQALPLVLERFLQDLALKISRVIIEPPVQGMHVSEWAKKELCWQKVKELDVPLPFELDKFVLSTEEARTNKKEDDKQGRLDNKINALTTVINLGTDYWSKLSEWSKKYSPIFGKEADLIRFASRQGWVPSGKQAATLVALKEKLEREGFRYTK